MPVKIRLMRIGAKKQPFYRVVAIDERVKRNGRYLELLGTYNPMSDPKEINLKKDRIEDWVKKGAQPSIGYLRMIGKAPQRPPRKPKKERVPTSAKATGGQAGAVESKETTGTVEQNKEESEGRLPPNAESPSSEESQSVSDQPVAEQDARVGEQESEVADQSESTKKEETK